MGLIYLVAVKIGGKSVALVCHLKDNQLTQIETQLIHLVPVWNQRMKEKAQAVHARAFLRSSVSPWLLRTTQPTRLGMKGQQLRTDDNDDGPQRDTQQERKHTFLLVIWLYSLIIFGKHDGQDGLPVVTWADVGDDFDGFLAPRNHQEVDLEGDPVGVHHFPGGKQRQNHQVMEPAGDRLPLSIETFGDFDIAVEQVVRYDSMELEPDSLRGFGDVDQDPVGDGLGT